MWLPLLLIGLAVGAAAMIAYGTAPTLTLSMIILSRRLEWPLITLSLLSCIALLGLVISGKRRVWWLLGLAPVLALFFHRFDPWDQQRPFILESPIFVQPQQLSQPPDEWVVGVVFENQAYALPYWALYATPVVFVTDYDKRMLLMWSAHANRATAYTITHGFKSRDIEIVSTPGDTLLLMDRRLGQFIVAVTAETVKGAKPIGFMQPVPTIKTTWSIWQKMHPATKVLRGYQIARAPMGPILPLEPDKLVDGLSGRTLISVIDTSPATAVASDSINDQFLNISAGTTQILLLRDPRSHRLRAFNRNVKEDLFLTFQPRQNRKYPDAIMTDADSGSWWTIDGKAIEGELKGSQLKEIPLEQDLYWGVMKRWYPRMKLMGSPSSDPSRG